MTPLIHCRSWCWPLKQPCGVARLSRLRLLLGPLILLLAQPALAVEPTVSRALLLDSRRDLVMVFFGTAMLFLLLWAILNYLLDRQPEVGLFAVHQATYTLFGIAAGGGLALYFPARLPQMADWASAILFFAINCTAVLFCREFFKLYDPHPAMTRVLNALMCGFPALFAAFALGYHEIAIRSNALLTLIVWLALAANAFALREEDFPRRWILRAFFSAICLANAAFWVTGQKAGVPAVLSPGGIQVLLVDGMAVSGLFAVMLKARAIHAQRRTHQSFLDLMRIQKKFDIERELKRQAELQAQTDFLTGLLNRRCFVESAENELVRAMRFQRPFSLLMFDIDHFKSINDTWGHAVGDVVLQEVSRIIRDALRNRDIFGRIGGEEFAIILVETEGNFASSVAQRLCTTIAEAKITPAGGERIPVTISIGLAPLMGRSLSFEQMLNEADQAMYAAKNEGRNRVCVAA